LLGELHQQLQPARILVGRQMSRLRLYLLAGAVATAIGAAVAAGAIALGPFGSEPTAAADPRVVFYRDSGLFVADLSGAAAAEVAPATASPLYAGGASNHGETFLYYSTRDGVDMAVHRRSLSTGEDAVVTTITGAPEGVTLRLSPNGQHIIVAAGQSLQLIESSSGQSASLVLAAEYGHFAAGDWSPDSGLVVVWAAVESSDVGFSLILDPFSAKVLGTIPGDRASWSRSGSRVCGSVAGAPGDAVATVWIAAAPDWTAKPGLKDVVIPATSCDWLNDQEVVFATRSWPLLQGENSPLPVVTAEVYGALDKTRPEETRVSLGTAQYIVPVLGLANLAANRASVVSILRQEFIPGTTVLESDLIEPYNPKLVAAPTADRTIVSAEGRAPTIYDLKSGNPVVSLQPGDEILDVIAP
ncbi:MAG TPA: hypothetical protein VFT91_00700, partial [Dehalococcoidia bacterium]|nr:hypothetical protein [Dehalococcoidia bacterium]